MKKAIGIKPNHANAHYNLGIAYGEKGMIKEAFSEKSAINIILILFADSYIFFDLIRKKMHIYFYCGF